MNPVWESLNKPFHEPCYLIVGSGLAAAVNHVTLRASGFGSKRIGGLTVVHIGMDDPWGKYNPTLAMGQWPNALILPGFQARPGFSNPRDFLPSGAFAQATLDEYKRIAKLPEVHLLRGIVTDIQRPPGSTVFLVTASDGQRTRRFEAQMIDLCTGPGRESEVPGSPGAPSVLRSEEFLDATFSMPSGRHICVAGGLTAAWCVERALACGNRVTWIARRLHDGFHASLRNDALARPFLERGVSALFSASADLEFIDGCEITGAAPVPGGSVRALISAAGPTTPRWVDSRGADRTPPASLDFDILVSALGLDIRAPHAAGGLAGRLNASNPASTFSPIVRPGVDQRIFGFEAMDGAVRILGAAGAAYGRLRSSNFGPLREFEATLPGQARAALLGVTLNAVTVALANRADSLIGPNSNAAGRLDLNAHFPGNGSQIAAVIDKRKHGVHALLDPELANCGLPGLKYEY